MDELMRRSPGIDRSYFLSEESLHCSWEQFLHNAEIINEKELEVWLGNFFSMDVGIVGSSFGHVYNEDRMSAIAIMDSIPHHWVTVIIKFWLYIGRNASVISPKR